MLKVKVDADEILKTDYFPGLISNSNSLLYESKTARSQGRFSLVLGLLIDKGWNGV